MTGGVISSDFSVVIFGEMQRLEVVTGGTVFLGELSIYQANPTQPVREVHWYRLRSNRSANGLGIPDDSR